MHTSAAMIRTLLCLGMLALAGASVAQEASPPAAQSAESTDDSTSNCVSLIAIRSTKVVDGRTILFEMNGNRTLVNRLPRDCPGLKFEKRFLYKTSLNQLCSQDMITVLTNQGRGATCGLGKFEAYVPPEAVQDKPEGGSLEPM